MSCEHEVRFTIKPTDDACRFHFDVRAYKDRIVAPDEYSGVTVVTPTNSEQILTTKDKTVRANITVNPAPVESLATSENGTFVPSSDNVGFSEVVVDVEPSLESLSVTENGLYLPESGTDGFDRVNVNVPIPTFKTEEKTVTENGIYLPSAGVDGISKVTVSVPETIPDLIPLTATANGQYTATGHDGFSDVTVDVPPTVPVLQGKSVNPSETAQHVTPDSGYDGLSAVDVGAIPSSYVGSGITRRSGSDLTASGNTVNVPSGYYESSGSKTVQSGSAGTPTASKSTVSNNAVTVTPSVSNTEGYISGGTKTGNAVTVSASELVSGTKEVSITDNGTTIEDVTNYADAEITVNVVNQDYEDALVALGVTEDLTDSIEALTTYANGVTGESDTTLSDAVESLADGYGGGGTAYPFLVSYERIDVTEDLTSMTTAQFLNRYLPDLHTAAPYPTILYLIENTYTDSRYSAQAAIRLSSLSGSYSGGTSRFLVRSSGGVSVGNNNFGIGQGSVLHKYTFGTA